MENKKYSIGDIGTSSIGFTVVDENNRVMRVKGKMQLVRLFSEGQPTADRRSFRTTPSLKSPSLAFTIVREILNRT